MSERRDPNGPAATDEQGPQMPTSKRAEPRNVSPAMLQKLARWGRRAFPVMAVGLVLYILLVAVAGPQSAACNICHRNVARRAASSAHAQVSCDSCHAASASEWLRLRALEGSVMPVAALGRTGLTDGRPISNRSCVKCHAKVFEDVVARNGLKIRHDVCLRPWQRCSDCHGGTGHADATPDRGAEMSSCLVCHDDRKAPSACSTCHVEGRPRAKYISGNWAAVHLSGGGRSHGMGNLASCTSCHSKKECVRCHGLELPHGESFPREHGKAAVAAPKSCTGCHQRSACTSCHGLEMPHPKGFLAAHSKAAKSRDDQRCLKCHLREDCDACHVDHTHPGRVDAYRGDYQ